MAGVRGRFISSKVSKREQTLRLGSRILSGSSSLGAGSGMASVRVINETVMEPRPNPRWPRGTCFAWGPARDRRRLDAGTRRAFVVRRNDGLSLLFFKVLHKISSVWRAGFRPSAVRLVSLGLPNVQDAILLAETIPRRMAVPRAVRAWEWGTIKMARGSRTDEELADSDESWRV
jgi:hypothetical protein